MPSNWFVEAARGLQFNDHPVWGLAALKLILCAAILTAVAGLLFRNKFKTGLQA
jgi:hypothetical protein